MSNLKKFAERQHLRRFERRTRAQIALAKKRTFLAASILSLLLIGCHLRQAPSEVIIEFTKIPPAAQGGQERMDTIAGRVSGARKGQMIVVYAKSGPWWVQPLADKPLTPILADNKWSTPTHLGYEYAALLVEPSYHPPPTLDATPTRGGSVIAVSMVKGVGTLPPNPTKPIHFSGYDWKVRTVAADAGGFNSPYDADNAWTDDSGALHLRISKKSGRWSCAQVVATRSLGYGTYVIVVREAAHLEPPVVLAMETFDEWAGDQYYREMGVEIGRWGDPAAHDNAQYDVQPFYISGNVTPFSLPSGTLTHTLRWDPGKAVFETVRGSSARNRSAVISRHVFTSGIPSPGKELFQFTLYLVASDKSPLQKETEVVVEKFEYLP